MTQRNLFNLPDLRMIGIAWREGKSSRKDTQRAAGYPGGKGKLGSSGEILVRILDRFRPENWTARLDELGPLA